MPTRGNMSILWCWILKFHWIHGKMDYGLPIEHLWLHSMSNFVISRQNTLKIHRNHNFNWKIIIPIGFDLWNKHSPLINNYVPHLKLAPRYSDCESGWNQACLPYQGWAPAFSNASSFSRSLPSCQLIALGLAMCQTLEEWCAGVPMHRGHLLT